jgi:hypothetical protein
MLRFDRISPPGSLMASDSFERVWLHEGRDLDNLNYEVIPRLELHGALPRNGDEAFTDLKAIGIDWALVAGPSSQLNEPNYLSEALTTHGKIEFALKGWDLFRFVQTPPKPKPLAACDRVAHGVSVACWGGPRTAAGNLTISVTRIVPVCDGETLAVTVTQTAGGPASPVLIGFGGTNPPTDAQPGGTLPGLTQVIYATAPPGASSASIIVSPIGGAQVSSLSVGSLSRSCASGGG